MNVILVSVDAMVYKDLFVLRNYPNISSLLEHGSLVRNMKTIYPSLTHAVHASIMTGNTPGKTGIIGNEHFSAGETSPKWFNAFSELHCESIFHYAKRAGLVTSACRWPVTEGGEEYIDYLIPEIMDSDLEEAESVEALYQSKCSQYIYQSIVQNHLHRLQGNEHPFDEEFSIHCACDIIRLYKPNLLLTHPCYIDDQRHKTGLFGSGVKKALEETDKWIGMLIDATKEAGIYSDTNFVICSDHGHRNYSRIVALNAVLAKDGLINVDESGKVSDWTAWIASQGLSAAVYVHHKEDEDRVKQYLLSLMSYGVFGFSSLMTKDEANNQYGLSGDFSFILEGDGITRFSNEWGSQNIQKCYNLDNEMHSAHGHMPEKGPQPYLLVSGPAFKENIILENGNILDIAPTIARILHLSMPSVDGTPLQNLLKLN